MSSTENRPSSSAGSLLSGAKELVQLIAQTRIGRAQLRAQARKGAVSAALKTAKGAARESRADKSRLYAIAIEIAGALGVCAPQHVDRVVALRARLRDMVRNVVH